MMLMPDRKKVVSLILEGIGKVSKDGPSYPKEKKEKGDEDMSIALKDAMGKFLSAIEKKDVEGMVNYLRDFVYLCHPEESKSSEETEY